MRYAVLDKGGLVLNHILLDDPLPGNYYPGYGQWLLPLDGTPDLKFSSGMDVIELTPSEMPQIGDTIDLADGRVTKFVPQIAQVTDEAGNTISVAMAPDVKFETTDKGGK